jgi:GTP:adenosylcobinamide-phosphate guanylyltransferase/thiamine kinase-like enzyme
MRKCLILAAGKGSRMGNDVVHKGLLPISGKAVISSAFEHIKCDEFVIAVGFKSQQIIDYCACAHPDIKIKFVHVDNYDKPGSGPGYSMYCCKNELQEPFIITTVDSYLTADLPILKEDWIGITEVIDPENYSTCDIDSQDYVINFQNKNKHSKKFAFTGIMGVQSYSKFWNKFDNYFATENEKEVEAIGPLYDPAYAKIKGIKICWKDTGRKSLYENLKKNSWNFASYELPKINISECTYKINNKVIKLATPEIIKNKKARANLLKGLVPSLCCENFENVMAYNFIDGKTLYENDNTQDFIAFLHWVSDNLFKTTKNDPLNEESVKNFYINKTKIRINKFIEMYNLSGDNKFNINGKECLSLNETINLIPWEKITKTSISYRFHGDLNFGNAIIDKNKKFTLIDWREDFEGNHFGDLYYDLAKLYAGSAVNFMVASSTKNLIDVAETIRLHDCQTQNTSDFLCYYEKWLKEQNYDCHKVKLIAFLTYLNMSPLHPDDFGQYLFYKGILELNKIIKHE